MLLAEEITVRESRRIKAALQMARLGSIKTLWCINGLPELPILRSVFQMIRTETGMPSLSSR